MARSFTFVTSRKYLEGPRKGYPENSHYILVETGEVIGSIRTAWGQIGFYGPRDTFEFWSGNARPVQVFENLNEMLCWLYGWLDGKFDII